jgi:hypothetical protein
MNERALKRLIRTVALGSIPWSVAAAWLGCSDSVGVGPSAGSDAGGPQEGAAEAASDVTTQEGSSAIDSGGNAAAVDAVGAESVGSQQDGAIADDAAVAATDSFNPCDPARYSPALSGSSSSQGSCGGGYNMCVVPDADTQPLADGGQYGAACFPFCSNYANCDLVEVDAQQLVRCFQYCTGRRPAGLVPDRRDYEADLAAFLANAAYLESASVAAFAVLRDELGHHGAPRAVVRSAGRAARDEVRHARVMGTLARRHGAACRVPRVVRRPMRSLVEIAVENAVEGCVRETYGAVIAAYQSRTAVDDGVRAAMKAIANDEARHASLAWTIGAWIEGRLTSAERSRVAEARREAV